ncbi:MAG TPA: NAD(P)-binding domain-containing protein [Anaerolinea sp.]|nr:NAD(P)-binding domain-containing protein [Anaerolinea sp.]
MNTTIETIIIGGGQGGLAVSYFLGAAGREHIVLEKAAQPGNAWRNDRWDSFTLVTPNWSFRLPGAEYTGDQPGGYMPRVEIVRRFEAYVQDHRLPVEFGVTAESVEADGAGYRVRTSQGELHARNVVVATGLFQRPKIPAYAAQIPASILQVHSGKYRNPAALPPGAVLVAGAGQSGCQIAEELYQSGREVYLSTGKAGRTPRHYRGKDIYEWVDLTGFINRTSTQLPSPQMRFASNPQITGKDGGHTLNLHQFARDGVHLLGRLVNSQDGSLILAPDLMQNLAASDALEKRLVEMIDQYILKMGLDLPEEALPDLKDGYNSPIIERLALAEAGISTVIWAIGYDFDFDLVRLPVFDEAGFPITQGGVTRFPGLYFAGLPWLPGQKTGLLLGVGEQARSVAADIMRL